MSLRRLQKKLRTEQDLKIKERAYAERTRTKLHERIKHDKEMHPPGPLYRLMNTRGGEWGLVNGQLVHYDPYSSKIDRFVKHMFKL